jgi:hypothetical protein
LKIEISMGILHLRRAKLATFREIKRLTPRVFSSAMMTSAMRCCHSSVIPRSTPLFAIS